MSKTKLGSVPKDIHPLIERLMNDLRTILNEREFVQPVWFMVDRRNERMMPIMAPFQDEEDKLVAAHMIRTLVLAEQPHVDAVIFMCEAWQKNYHKGEPGYDDRKTPIKDRPGNVDVIMVMVETYDGVWIADPVVTGKPGMKRELSDIEFVYQDGYDGDMAGYLPPRSKREVN